MANSDFRGPTQLYRWGRMSRESRLLTSVSVAYFIFLTLLPNEFHWSDEYRFAAFLKTGEAFFSSHHILSSLYGYLAWWLAALSGFSTSAYGALRLFNELMAAAGLFALMRIGLTAGLTLRTAIAAATFFAFSNGTLRYALSAYPGVGAVGLAFVGFAVAYCVPEAAPSRTKIRRIAAGSLLFALAAGQHSLMLLVGPGILLGLTLKHRELPTWKLITACGIPCLLGFGLMQLLFVFLSLHYPTTVFSSFGSMGVEWGIFSVSRNLPLDLKTHLALLFPGIHHPVRFVDLLFNIPRVLASMALVALGVQIVRRRIDFTVAALTLVGAGTLAFLAIFLAMFLIYPNSRQYGVMSMFGLSLMLVGALRVIPPREQIVLLAVLLPTIFLHGVFGVEGLQQIASPRCPSLKASVERYGLFTREAPPWPLFGGPQVLPRAKLYEIIDIDCEDSSVVIPKY